MSDSDKWIDALDRCRELGINPPAWASTEKLLSLRAEAEAMNDANDGGEKNPAQFSN